MDCSEARSLIRRNMIAGAGPGRVPQLGFHLVGCEQCRERYLAHRARNAAASSPSLPLPASRGAASQPSNKARSQVLRIGVYTLLALGLVLTWFVGLPLVRAVEDVFVMTSLGRSDTDLASVGHISSPPSALLATASLPSTPISTPTPPPTKTPSPNPTQSRVVVQQAPTELALRDQADRWTSRDHTSTTHQTIKPIQKVPRADRLSTLPVQGMDTEQTVQPADGSTTILFLGLDAREGERFVARSDAILVAHLDPRHDRVSMLSLPRDLWVNIPGAGQGKINSAFIIGEQVGEGAALAKETVGDAIGVAIDHVVVMDFTGFRSLVDALDGITVDVPTELYDPLFPTEDYGYRVAHFMPGRQRFDGEEALTYSRIRHPDSDFQRMRRQEAVVLAIASRIRDRGMIRNLRDADRLTSALRPYMRTDMSPATALDLLWSIRTVDLASTDYISADASLLVETNIGGAYAVYADASVLRELGARLIEGE